MSYDTPLKLQEKIYYSIFSLHVLVHKREKNTTKGFYKIIH